MTAGDEPPSAGEPPPLPPRKPMALGGWLILIAVGLVLWPIVLLALILQTHVPIFMDGRWDVLTTPGTEVYHWLWGPLLLYEVLGNIAFLVAHVWLLVIFFKRSRVFPKLFIWVFVLKVPFMLSDTLLCSVVAPDVPVFDPDTVRELGKSIVVALIWVPYMLVSRRVKNTFVV